MVREPLRRCPGSEAVVGCFRYLCPTVPPRLLIIRRGKLSIEMETPKRGILVPALCLKRRLCLAALLLAIASVLAGCAALQPLSATGPRGNEALYPILSAED